MREDPFRLVFMRLHAAGAPDGAERALIYQQCRDEVAAGNPEGAREALERLEVAIRRNEAQALYEETLRRS
jgi:hypothetical protein